MMTGNTAIHIASQLQSGAPRKAAFLVAVQVYLGWLFPQKKARGLLTSSFGTIPVWAGIGVSGY